MPCHVWRNLATKAMSIRESYSYFAFNKEAEMVSERNRTQSMKEREEAYVAACNAMDTHRQYCEICKQESPENFRDPWAEGTRKVLTEHRRPRPDRA